MQDFYTPEIARKIRERRAELGFTQAELAKQAGTTKQNIAAYEQERAKPKYETLLRMAVALDLALDWLLKNEGPKTIAEHHAEAVDSEWKLLYPDAGEMFRLLKKKGIATKEELERFFDDFDLLKKSHVVWLEELGKKVTKDNYRADRPVIPVNEKSPEFKIKKNKSKNRVSQILRRLEESISNWTHDGPTFIPTKGEVPRREIEDFVKEQLEKQKINVTLDEFLNLVDKTEIAIKRWYSDLVTPRAGVSREGISSGTPPHKELLQGGRREGNNEKH